MGGRLFVLHRIECLFNPGFSKSSILQQLPQFQIVRWQSEKPTRQQLREAERAARRARRLAMEQKRAQIEAAVESRVRMTTPRSESHSKQAIAQEKSNQWHEERRQELIQEAARMTKSLYRSCLRSINVMRTGNKSDEEEFRRREEAQLSAVEEALQIAKHGGGSFSMSPPVDRENELSSRATYYYAWAREGFLQESDCLDHNPWREEDVDRYLYFLKEGESRRKWILNDYKFADPTPSFDEERLIQFEDRARELLRDIYKARHGPEADGCDLN